VDAEDPLATLDVGRADGHLTIEVAGMQQRRSRMSARLVAAMTTTP
jgi:hypothetical protein